MLLQYDPEADSLYVALGEREGRTRAERLDEFRILRYDERGALVGAEFLLIGRAGINLDGIPRADEISAALQTLSAAAA